MFSSSKLRSVRAWLQPCHQQPQKVEGFSPCYVDPFPAFGPIKRFL
jgi:hypothetical protein